MTTPLAAPKADLVDEFIGENLPDWLSKAQPAQIKALRDGFAAHRLTEQGLATALQRLVPLQAFALPLLQQTLERDLGLKIDLLSVLWRERWTKFSLPGNQAFDTYQSHHPALYHLLQNFPDDAEFGAGSGFVAEYSDDRDAPALFDNAKSVALACNRLDIGKQYQAHLTEVFDSSTLALLVEDKRQRFDLAIEIAALKKSLVRADLDLLRLISAGKPAVHVNYDIAQVRPLTLLGHPLDGALTVELGRIWRPRVAMASLRIEAVLLYLPDQPLSRFDSWRELQDALVERLQNSASQAKLIERMALKDRASCQQRLSVRLKDSKPDLEPMGEVLAGDVFVALADAHVSTLRSDARYLAVPTQDVNTERKWSKLRALESVGETYAQLAGLFVPVLNAVLIGRLVVQVLGEVFEGVDDWARGHQHEALEHLLGVVESVAVNAALAGAGHYVAGAFSRSAFVDELVPVSTQPGTHRLWHEDLSPFREQALPSGAVLGENGLYSDGVNHWWQQEGYFHSVHQPDNSGEWQLRRTDGRAGFGPTLFGNGEGAWHLAWQRPGEWQGARTLLTHLWPRAAELDDVGITQVLRISGMDEAALRGLAVERRPLPAVLRDTLLRFTASTRIDRFFNALEQDIAHGADSSLFDYCLEQLVDPALDGSELAGQMIDDAPRLRHALMARLSTPEVPEGADLSLIRRDFPGLPEAYALDLLSQENAVLVEQMNSRNRVPLALAEQAREALQSARVARAIEALVLGNSYSNDLPELVFGLLRRHAGWPMRINFEVREGSAFGRLTSRLFPSSTAGELWTLVWEEGGVRVYQDGLEAVDAPESPLDLFASLLAFLPDEHLDRLGWSGEAGATAMRQDLLSWLPARRDKVISLLGMSEIRPSFRPGRRMPDGRYGYPLSGRASAGSSAARTLRDRVRALYPGFSDGQVETYVELLGNSPGSAFTNLLSEELEFRSLNRALRTWVQDPPLASARSARQLLADELLRSWRIEGPIVRGGNNEPGMRLSLIGVPVGELPVLPAGTNFRHVLELNLINLGLSAVPAGFLRHFGHLRSLNLSNNMLSELPGEMHLLTSLRTLNLSRNQLQMDATAYSALEGLQRLRILNLSRNPLQTFSLSLRPLQRLYELELRMTQLSVFPADLVQAELLEYIDLRDNGISELPDALLQAPLSVRQALRLEGNPLPGDYAERLSGHVPSQAVPSSFNARESWLEHLEEGERERRAAQWDRLSEEEGSEELFALLGRLVQSSDFRLARTDLEQRVWALLDGIELDTRLREDIFNFAANPTTCVDSVASCFSALQVRAFIANGLRDVPAAQAQSTRLMLGRRLFRLDRVEQYARDDMVQRVENGAGVDEVEVSLAYRVGLARELDLPGQARSLQFETIAGVTRADLDAVVARVREAEAGDELAQFISERDFWLDYLRETEPAQFAAIEAPSDEQMSALDERRDELADLEYVTEAKALKQSREADLQALALRLTRDALDAGR